MKNIVNAIKAEKEYVNLALLGKDVHFMDIIAKFGYTSFDEFHKDKTDYNLKTLKWDIVCQPEINLILTNNNIALQKPAFMYSINTKDTYAFVKTDYPYKENLKGFGYKIVELGYNSKNGVILSYNGDLRVYLIVPNTIDVSFYTFLHKISEYLNTLGINSEVDNNDVLVDGKKVCGGGMFSINGMLNIVFQINFTDHSEEIEKICGKGKKRPGYIHSDIVTPERLKDEFVSWIKF